MRYFAWYYVVGLMIMVIGAIGSIKYDEEYQKFMEESGDKGILYIMLGVFTGTFIWPYFAYNTISNVIHAIKKRKGS